MYWQMVIDVYVAEISDNLGIEGSRLDIKRTYFHGSSTVRLNLEMDNSTKYSNYTI